MQETEATLCDYRGALEHWSTNGFTLSEDKTILLIAGRQRQTTSKL